ncbi:ATP-grasp domain-containing protein [Gracilibacillus salitolerans]|uniref:Acylphosphatase n=1 Tax=Gracilibacillus salitolerans TaxID=2663022 RepID=A0A5Q2TMX4_9BACI|nr:acylphosphatase [Gracilibacillus salitolerans]QGH36309.1 ATP-grasp domain-containing protein [Gracilibacillus salitolerans]
MNSNQVISLPHLTNEIVRGARKTKLCAYAVALEGWRRGLKLKWYTIDSGKFDEMITFGVNPPGRLFSLSSETETHYFFRTRGDKVSNEAVDIGSDKNETKQWLKKAGVPVPAGDEFHAEAGEAEILAFAEQVGYPLVLKPTNGSLGNGVITNIKSPEELKKAVNYVRNTLGYEDLIVEQYMPGEEYRVYVVEDRVVAAYNRLPANIIGDGEHTIEELIQLKNEQRRKNARLFSCLIDIDQETLEFIGNTGYQLDSIPKKDEKILLKEKTNVSAGGDPVDVTDEIPEEFKEIAINAVKEIPGLYHGGVDIIVDLNKPINQAAVVIELNPTAQIGGILFPMRGRARDIPSAIVDYYFPKTKDIKTDREKVYFDFNTVLSPLQNRSGEEVEVAPALIGEIYQKRYVVTGKVNQIRYHRYIKNKALEQHLSGYITTLMDGEIEVIVAGTDKRVVNQFKQIITDVQEFAEIKKIIEETFDQPVRIGFEISEELESSSIKNINTVIKRYEKELHKMRKDKRRLEKENIKIKLSRSWRFTGPLRLIKVLLKPRES